MAFTGSEILNDVTMMHMNNGIKRKRIEAEHQGMDDQQSTSKFLKKGKILHHLHTSHCVWLIGFLLCYCLCWAAFHAILPSKYIMSLRKVMHSHG